MDQCLAGRCNHKPVCGRGSLLSTQISWFLIEFVMLCISFKGILRQSNPKTSHIMIHHIQMCVYGLFYITILLFMQNPPSLLSQSYFLQSLERKTFLKGHGCEVFRFPHIFAISYKGMHCLFPMFIKDANN